MNQLIDPDERLKAAHEELYGNVPGKGDRLEDGTFWTPADEQSKATVGSIVVNQYYDRRIQNGEWWASDRRVECIECTVFGGNLFKRWRELPRTEFRPCVLDSNRQLRYK